METQDRVTRQDHPGQEAPIQAEPAQAANTAPAETLRPTGEDAKLLLDTLREREELLNQRERRLKAADMLRQRGLPREALALLDVGSDEGLERSLLDAQTLCAVMQKGAAPRLSPPKDTGKLTYAQRAALFVQNGGRIQERLNENMGGMA